MKRAVPIAASALLVLALAGAVDAANPNRSYQLTVCWTGSQVTLEQTWSAFNVDEVAFGIGNGSEGLGVQYPIPRSRSGDETATLSPAGGSTIAGGTLFFHGKVVVEDTITIPEGGWSALPACP